MQQDEEPIFHHFQNFFFFFVSQSDFWLFRELDYYWNIMKLVHMYLNYYATNQVKSKLIFILI